MPRRDVRMYLFDIVKACDDIASHVAGATLKEFQESRFLQAAVERELMIVGEAMVQAFKQEPGIADRITGTPSIMAFRNILVHAYDIIDHEKMWSVVITHAPILRKEAAALLAERETASG